MPNFQESTVVEVIGERAGLVRVVLDDGSRAYGLTQLTGAVSPGDRVIVNTTAVDLGLGTGGWHVIHWNLSEPAARRPGPGHLIKLRYTSLQVDTGSAEEQGDVPQSLDGCPVVVAGVHSQVPVIVAAAHEAAPAARIVYVMTDGGALPLALSDLVADLRERSLLIATVTAGHAFGGDLEALNVPAALVMARHRLRADIIVVGMGPGGAGTASRLGFSALDAASSLDAVDWLGGRAIACARMSSADPRPRHLGLSHHTSTVLDAVRSTVDVAIPAEASAVIPRHRVHPVEGIDVADLLRRHDLEVTTMGRTVAEDPLYFEAAAAAGLLAARSLDTSIASS